MGIIRNIINLFTVESQEKKQARIAAERMLRERAFARGASAWIEPVQSKPNKVRPKKTHVTSTVVRDTTSGTNPTTSPSYNPLLDPVSLIVYDSASSSSSRSDSCGYSSSDSYSGSDSGSCSSSD